MKTYSPSILEVERRWYVVDADGKTLGRLSSEIARLIMGKHKPTWTPHLDTGDHVIVVNASKVRLTGSKLQQKTYARHSGYPGGFRERTLAQMMERFPERVVETAVKGMLPHNRLGSAMLKKLHVFAGPTHEHAAQRPIALSIGGQAATGEGE